MADDPVNLRNLVGPTAESDSELQAICRNYDSKYNDAVKVLSSIGNVMSYVKKTNGPSLVITLMLFPNEVNFSSAEQDPRWNEYKLARNALMDALNVRMEVKRYETEDAIAWFELVDKTPEQLSQIFDGITDATYLTYS